MANDDVMAVDERVARLESTMARGFLDQGQRIGRLEDRMAALDSKFDVVVESIRGDIKGVLEAVTALAAEMRRTTRSIRREHEADRRITKSVLLDLARIRTLEGRGTTRRKRRES
ncbi:MAG: hypothetical protein AB7P34_19280 [Vicinamibacterales bacterium]